MRKVYRSAIAQLDIDGIWDHIAKDSVRAADHVLDAIEKRCSLLAQFSELGQPRDDLLPGLRGSSVGNYLILYRITTEGIEIARVLHGSRDIEAMF